MNKHILMALVFGSTFALHSAQDSTQEFELKEMAAENQDIDRAKIIVIGATGKQGEEYCDILKDFADIAAFVVSPSFDEQKRVTLAKQLNIPILVGVDGLNEAIAQQQVNFDTALVTVPHDQHRVFTIPLLQSGKVIIKEKPLAMNYQEFLDYEAACPDSSTIPLLTIVQRRFQPSLEEAKKDIRLIGNPLTFSYDYMFKLPEVTSGWRADKSKSGGGVVLDMGYHPLDVVNDFFGTPDSVEASFDFCYPEMREQDLEDRAVMNFIYPSGIEGTVQLSRQDQAKEEFFIRGTTGTITITPAKYVVHDLGQKLIKSFEPPISPNPKRLIKETMLRAYLNNRFNGPYIAKELARHKNTLRIIDRIYRVAKRR